jgi:hypothetical protein
LETAKISGDLYAGHVAMSLGMYISERNEGAFKDAFITFNNNPALQVISGSLSEYNQLQHSRLVVVLICLYSVVAKSD